jgi:hypothetical protein
MKTSRLAQLLLAASLVAALSLAAHAAEAAKTPSKPKPAAAHAAKPAVPFLEDDYPEALAQARARKVPIFIEAWAPW